MTTPTNSDTQPTRPEIKPIRPDVIARLAAYRKENAFSYEELGKLIGSSATQINRALNGNASHRPNHQ